MWNAGAAFGGERSALVIGVVLGRDEQGKGFEGGNEGGEQVDDVVHSVLDGGGDNEGEVREGGAREGEELGVAKLVARAEGGEAEKAEVWEGGRVDPRPVTVASYGES